MPHKNNLTIYEHVFCHAVAEYGLWDQIVVDCGTEFYLSLFIQEHLQLYRIDENRQNSTRLPYRQIRSTENNRFLTFFFIFPFLKRIERMWVEVNQRILYAYKRACIHMQEKSVLVPNNLSHAFVLSWLLQKCVSIQLERFIDAWNHHPIPKSGPPVAFLAQRKNYILAEGVVPKVDDAVALYIQTHPSAELTIPHHFVEDIIPEENMIERDKLFERILEINLEEIVNSTANNNFTPFENCFLKLITIQESFFLQ